MACTKVHPGVSRGIAGHAMARTLQGQVIAHQTMTHTQGNQQQIIAELTMICPSTHQNRKCKSKRVNTLLLMQRRATRERHSIPGTEPAFGPALHNSRQSREHNHHSMQVRGKEGRDVIGTSPTAATAARNAAASRIKYSEQVFRLSRSLRPHALVRRDGSRMTNSRIAGEV
ncbi:hypothetical protein QAD02_013656 [Eretmocerus hayati]|uniref:Uncharacterized protein n=1 Tax=Eretmocerus hayati TaxID=131215 RepID=A0ACC2P5Q0_9HYME|nr:hypothetical protein QAD02_013656 [Eretmocerus hayati]